MKLKNLCITTRVMRHGMTLRDFFEEVAECRVPGLPFVDDQGNIIGRISLRNVYKHMAVPDHVLRIADAMGDNSDMLDLPEMTVQEDMKLPVENCLLETIPSVSPKSPIVKALAIMELHNTSYVFLIDDGKYLGVITRMVIARRMLQCIKETESKAGTS